MRLFTFSFDDGHPEDGKAFDIMMKHGIRGTFYVTAYPYFPRSMDSFLKFNFYKDIHKELEVGSHGGTHEDLRTLDDIALYTCVSKEPYQDVLGEIQSFSAPWGYVDARIKKVIQEAGYISARTTTIDKTCAFPVDLFDMCITKSTGCVTPEKAIELRDMIDDFMMIEHGVFNYLTHIRGSDLNAFEDMCKFIKSTGIKTVTNAELMEETWKDT